MRSNRNLLKLVQCRLLVDSVTKNTRYFSKNSIILTMDTFEENKFMKCLSNCAPIMSHATHKGQHGRIGVIGGSLEYTGAPYFAAMASLLVGADLSHVFCVKEAAPVIKSYSPELIVHPLLGSDDYYSEFEKWLPRLHALIIGPGLGRDDKTIKQVQNIIYMAKNYSQIPIVLDADGLYMVMNDSSVIEDYSKAVLTPNIAEFNKLCIKMLESDWKDYPIEDQITALSEKLNNITILLKGEKDIICKGDKILIVNSKGSMRRCGGQGDVLSGIIGTFLYWFNRKFDSTESDETLSKYGPEMLAAYCACIMTKNCSLLAYESFGRSMLASNLLEKIPLSFKNYIDKDNC